MVILPDLFNLSNRYELINLWLNLLGLFLHLPLAFFVLGELFFNNLLSCLGVFIKLEELRPEEDVALLETLNVVKFELNM